MKLKSHALSDSNYNEENIKGIDNEIVEEILINKDI